MLRIFAQCKLTTASCKNGDESAIAFVNDPYHVCHPFFLPAMSPPDYLKYGQETLIECVEVSPWFSSVAVLALAEPGPEHLHAEQGKDAHEEKEEEQEGGDRLDAVRQGVDQV